jgi:plasmid stabilization system protein ParE
MSSRRPIRIDLAPKARKDVKDILRYTAETWGRPQMLVYRAKIDDALQAISQNPQIGHRRSDLPPTHLAYLVLRPSQSEVAAAAMSRVRRG